MELCVRGSGGLGLVRTSLLVPQLLGKRQQAQGTLWVWRKELTVQGPPVPPRPRAWSLRSRDVCRWGRQEFRVGCHQWPQWEGPRQHVTILIWRKSAWLGPRGL